MNSYRITAEIVAADRAAALSILLKLVNDGYDSLRERGDLPTSWSQGDITGNGEFRAGLYSPAQPLPNNLDQTRGGQRSA